MVSKGFRRKNMKRKDLRRKTMKRKTMRRKTVRRKTMRRKTMRRKNVKRKTLRRKNVRRKNVRGGGFFNWFSKPTILGQFTDEGFLVTNYQPEKFIQYLKDANSETIQVTSENKSTVEEAVNTLIDIIIQICYGKNLRPGGDYDAEKQRLVEKLNMKKNNLGLNDRYPILLKLVIKLVDYYMKDKSNHIKNNLKVLYEGEIAGEYTEVEIDIPDLTMVDTSELKGDLTMVDTSELKGDEIDYNLFNRGKVHLIVYLIYDYYNNKQLSEVYIFFDMNRGVQSLLKDF